MRPYWWTNIITSNALKETQKQFSDHWCLLKIFSKQFANHLTGKCYYILITETHFLFPSIYWTPIWLLISLLIYFRVAVGECAQYHWLCYDQTTEEKTYIQRWLNYWSEKLKGYDPVSIKKCHGYVHETEGTVRMFVNGKK